MLDRHDDLSRDPGGDLSVALVEPVGLALGEGEHATHAFSEDEGHCHDRAHSAFEGHPVTGKRGVELGARLANENRLAREDL